MKLTPKAVELLYKLELRVSYSMSELGDQIFIQGNRESRQVMALKAGRFARQLQDANLICWSPKTRKYYLTACGNLAQMECQ